jgi:hypothetical protein
MKKDDSILSVHNVLDTKHRKTIWYVANYTFYYGNEMLIEIKNNFTKYSSNRYLTYPRHPQHRFTVENRITVINSNIIH